MLSRVDPFVRYAAKSTYFIDAKVVARDCRMLYILSGEGSFEVAQTRYPLSSGVLVYYPAGTPYHIHSSSELLFYTLNFDLSQAYAKQFPTPLSPRRGDVCHEPLLSEGIPEGLSSFVYLWDARFAEQNLRRIYEESARPTEHTEAAMSACLRLVLIDLLRGKASPVTHPLVSRVKELVGEDLCRNNLALARILGYHPYYLNEIFVREEGISLQQYRMKERAARARELITASSESLAYIAEVCGFSSPSHLSRAIRAEYGVTPSMMRKMQ